MDLKKHPFIRASWPLFGLVLLLILFFVLLQGGEKASLLEISMPGLVAKDVEQINVCLPTIGVEEEIDDPECIRALLELFSQMEAKASHFHPKTYHLTLKSSYTFQCLTTEGESFLFLMDKGYVTASPVLGQRPDQEKWRLCAGPSPEEIFYLLVAYGYLEILE